MMLFQLMLVFLFALINVQSHSFKQFRRRPFQPILTLPRGNLRLYAQRNYQPATPIFSIRGGNSDEYDENEYDETIEDLVASFDSELAAIRREAEMEAENELQKLRDLMERRGDLDDENKIEMEYDENVDELNEEHSEDMVRSSVESDNTLSEDGSAGAVVQSDTEREEGLPEDGTTEEVDQSGIESDEGVPEEGNSDAAVQAAVEIDEETSDGEMTEVVVQSEIGVGSSSEEETPLVEDDLVVHSDESDNEATDSVASVASSSGDDSDDNQNLDAKVIRGIKSKQSKKKKRKSSKKGKRVKARINYSPEESEMSDEGEIDLGDSVMLTRSQDEVAEKQETGIWFYLKSDLGRALCLFISTILLAMLTQRMQRQMEAEGI